MEKVAEFLEKLNKNNNREWFENHKNEYRAALEIFNDFVTSLIGGISLFDESIRNITVKDCTYRIYRDVRFSKNKNPYKTHMGAFICPKGKSSGYSGYYFHIEARESEYIGSNILSTGIYKPDPFILKSIREEIMLNGEKFNEAIEKAKGFSMDQSESLKKVPSGFPSDSPDAHLLKLKNYFLVKPFDNNFLSDKNLLENTLNEFKKTKEFNDLLNRSVDYAFEQVRE